MSTSAKRSASAGAALRPTVTAAELEVFYREFFMPLVRRAAWTHGLSKEDALDVVQEAFLLAIAKLDADGNPKAWLIQVVDHLAVNHNRKTLRRARLTAQWGAGPARKTDPADDPSDLDYEVTE